MGLETATYINDLVSTNPVGGTDPKSQGDDHIRLIKAAIKATFPNLSGAAWRVQSKASNYTVLTTDNMSVLLCTAALTLALTAAATLGNKHFFIVIASSGDVTIDPNSTENINGAATLVVPSGQGALVWCDGTALYALLLSYQALGTIISTDAGAGAAPLLTLDRQSASPADDDLLGAVLFNGKDDGANATTYAEIVAQALDVTDATEDGALLLYAMLAGTLTKIVTISAGVVVGSPTGGAPGAGKINAEDVLINGVSVSAAVPKGYLSGLAFANNGSDANNDVDIAVGLTRDSTDVLSITLSGALTKQLDAAWAVGTNQGGLDTGSKAVSTRYHIWLIYRSDTGVTDVLFSTSATAPTMPTNYDYKRRIGSFLTDASGNIIAFSKHAVVVRNGDKDFAWVVKTDVFGPGTSDAFADVTDLAIGVVGKSANSIFKLSCTAALTNDSAAGRSSYLRFARSAAGIGVGDTSGSKVSAGVGNTQSSANVFPSQIAMTHIDLPGAAGAIAYTVQYRRGASAGNIYIGRWGSESDTDGFGRMPTIFFVEEL